MTSRDWRRALNDPRIEVTSFTWSEDIGGPEEIGFLFTPNAWNAATPFRLYRKHSRFRLSVLLDGVVFEVHAYGLSNAELADEVVPLVIKDLTDDLGVRISVDHGGVPASGYFHWAPRPTWWRSAARAIARVLRGLVEDWRAIQRFAAGDAPPTPIRRRRASPADVTAAIMDKLKRAAAADRRGLRRAGSAAAVAAERVRRHRAPGSAGT